MHVFFCVSKNVSVSCAYTQGKREQFSGFNRTLDAINNVFRKFSAFHDETGRLNVDGMNIISNDGSNKLNRSRKADRKSGSAGMPRPISYAVFCLKKKRGRQLDSTVGTLEALTDIVAAVQGRVEVFMAGGVRRGTDVLKALAIGAKAVLIGRSALWGLALGGADGVRRVLEHLRGELELAMALTGRAALAQVDRSLVQRV